MRRLIGAPSTFYSGSINAATAAVVNFWARWYTEGRPSSASRDRFSRGGSVSSPKSESNDTGYHRRGDRSPASPHQPQQRLTRSDGKEVMEDIPTLNRFGDGELSRTTVRAIHDDGSILFFVLQHIPPNGAISVKSLYSQLTPDIQEALSEGYGGLKQFLQQRGQLFTLKANPVDQVLFVTTTPLVAQWHHQRELQRETMKVVLGIKRDPKAARGRGRGRGRGGQGTPDGRGRGGGDRRRFPASSDDRQCGSAEVREGGRDFGRGRGGVGGRGDHRYHSAPRGERFAGGRQRDESNYTTRNTGVDQTIVEDTPPRRDFSRQGGGEDYGRREHPRGDFSSSSQSSTSAPRSGGSRFQRR